MIGIHVVVFPRLHFNSKGKRMRVSHVLSCTQLAIQNSMNAWYVCNVHNIMYVDRTIIHMHTHTSNNITQYTHTSKQYYTIHTYIKQYYTLCNIV